MSANYLCLRNDQLFLLVAVFLNILPTKLIYLFIYLFLHFLNYYFRVTYLFLDFASSSSFLTSSHFNFWFQLNAHQFYFIYCASLHVSGTHVPIFRRINYTFTTTGCMSFSLGDRTVGRLVKSFTNLPTVRPPKE